MTSVSNVSRVYALIDSNASSNVTMQGLSGLLGFPFTLVADAGVIFTHYGPMINEIRKFYNRSPLGKDTLVPIVKGCSSEILTDLVLDKIVGQVPVIGIASNMICAKAMTWRLGLLFAMLSARGERVSVTSVEKAATLIRKLFPQEHSWKFQKPSVVIVEKLLTAVADEDIEQFENKIEMLLDAMAN